ncbi:tartrate transporter [Fusarium heterosporum]|uniref:Tartrate transporter n=1 Tax=Fusarium heterosporum TaxID=42747 RepID=A0A8H5X4M8_FUSHE|nr:tartrate transporter [Fusarium heterosporum]
MAAIIAHPMREAMLRDEVAYTMSIKLCKSIEIIGYAKLAQFHGVLIDCEHSSFDLETTNQLCVAALYAGISPIVRAPSKDPFFVSRILDGGALGIIVPHIRSVQDAQDVVNAAKFQPVGHRSSTNGLPHHQFRSIPAKVSNPITNAATMVIPMIETLEALELVDEIAALPGVDSLLIGTNDLTAEMGIPGDYENPRVTEAYERTIAACKKHGKFLGVGGLHARLDLVEKFCKMGARWVMAATDGPLLLGAASKRGAEMVALNAAVVKSTQAEAASNGKPATNGTVTNGATINGTHINGVTNGVPCDKLRPACTSCADLSVECIARSQQFDFNGEDTSLTHTRVHGYVESLRRRVAELEQKVQAAEQKHLRARNTSFGTSDSISPLDTRHAYSAEGLSSTQNNESATVDGEEQSTVQDTMSAIGLLSNKAMAESRANTGDVPHKLSITECIAAALAVDGRDPSRASFSEPSYMVDERLIPLKRDLMLSHMQRFLEWSAWLPHIEEDKLMEQFDSVTDMSTHMGTEIVGALPLFNTYLAIAIGINMSPEASRLASLASNLHTAAVKILPSILQSQEPLDTLHCMLLLGIFSLFNASGGSMWHLLGFIMTNCIAAGLHKSAIPQDRLGTQSIYRAEWLFWSVYLWDRSLASSLGRPFSITDGDVLVEIPEIVEDLPDRVKSRLTLSRHLIIHAQLISEVCSRDRAHPLFSYSNLCFWREFPPLTGVSSTNSWLDRLDQLACRALILTVDGVPGNMPNSNDEDIIQIETDTIKSCKRLIERFYGRSGGEMAGMSFLDAYDILAAAVAYVCLVQRPSQSDQQGLTQTFEVVSKASVVLTQCASKFSALSVFQRFLLSLSTKMMEGQGSLQQCPDFIPSEVPSHLRRLVESQVSTVTLTDFDRILLNMSGSTRSKLSADLKRNVEYEEVAPVQDEILQRYELIRDKTPEERAAIEKSLVRKLDWKFLPMVTAMLMMNYLDRINVSNARLAGMQEDLHMTDTVWSLGISMFYVGYILSQIPANVIIAKGSPRVLLPSCMLIWSCVTICMPAVTAGWGFCLCRFLIGLTEGPFVPAVSLMTSSWYTKHESPLRMGIWHAGNTISQAISGLLAAGILTNMDDVANLRAWQWFLLLEGIVSILVALVSFWFIPNFPDSTGTYFITEEEAAMAQYRQTVSAGGISEDETGDYWGGVWTMLKDPFSHLFATIHFFLIIAQSYKDFFPSIVATLGFKGTTTYLIQAPPPIIAFLVMLVISWSSGRRLEHGYHIIVPIILTAVGCAVMITTLNVGARYFSMILLVVGPFVGLNIQISWETTVVPRPRTKRAALIAYANCVSSVSHWFTPYFFLRNQEPYYQTGGGAIITGCGLVVVFVLITKAYVVKKNKELKAAEDAAGEPVGWRFAG